MAITLAADGETSENFGNLEHRAVIKFQKGLSATETFIEMRDVVIDNAPSSSDYYLFPVTKQALRRKNFVENEALEAYFEDCLSTRDEIYEET